MLLGWIVGKNSILNFSRQILNRNVQCPSSVSTVMTHHSAQPKPVWKKAPPGLQRPSRIATPSGWPSITPRYLTHTLDLALKAAGARVTVTIRLLKKDYSDSPRDFRGKYSGGDIKNCLLYFLRISCSPNDPFYSNFSPKIVILNAVIFSP